VPLLRGPVVLGGSVVDPMEIIQRQPHGGDLIFPCRRESVSVLFCTACSRCGIDDLTFHDLRHEATSRLFEASYTIEQVSLCTGHRDWNMLRRYTQIRPESLHRPENVVPFARVGAA
jgi:integrase